MSYLAVIVGSAIGGLLRYSLSVNFASRFPWPTFAINVLGSMIIGFAMAATANDGRYPLSPAWRALIMPGFCGGFTTFSTFSADTLALWQTSQPKAIGYVAASLIFSLAGVWIGNGLGGRR